MASPLSSNDHRYFTRDYIFIRHMICVLLGASCMICVFACFNDDMDYIGGISNGEVRIQ